MQVQIPVPFQLQPGEQPTPEQMEQIKQHIAQEAAKEGIPVQQYLQMLAQRQQQQQQQQQQQGQQDQIQAQPNQSQSPVAQPGQTAAAGVRKQTTKDVVSLNGPPPVPTPQALAIANFLRSQDLKTRTCVYKDKHRDLFRVKRAIRALMSPQYEKAQKKNPNLPVVTDRESAENAFKKLPLFLLAFQVEKIEPANESERKMRTKGQWNVRVVSKQGTKDDSHYVWLYEGSQTMQKVYSFLAIVVVIAVVMFPLWPLVLRQGVWYLSMGMLGLVGLFFALALVRLVIFCATVVTIHPGLWIYPNLFEDVGFFDSFRPMWAWQETPEERRQKKLERQERRLLRKKRQEEKANGVAASDSSPTASNDGGALQERAQGGNQVASKVEEVAGVDKKSKETGSSGVEANEGKPVQRTAFSARVEEDE